MLMMSWSMEGEGCCSTPSGARDMGEMELSRQGVPAPWCPSAPSPPQAAIVKLLPSLLARRGPRLPDAVSLWCRLFHDSDCGT